ncbi:MAG: hypothetical protein WCH43_15700 [Verrucomicrobiota bacterium]
MLAQQQTVVKALEIRFDRVPDPLREEIGHGADSARLNVLLRVAIRCAGTNPSPTLIAHSLLVAIRGAFAASCGGR